MEKRRSPLHPISLNAYIGHTFNGCEEAVDMNVHDVDPAFLRCRTAQSMIMSPNRPYVEKHGNLGRRFSPERLVIPLPPKRSTNPNSSIASNYYSNTDSNSSSNSGKSRASRNSWNSSKTRSSSPSRCSFTPSSRFSAFVPPASPRTPTPCLKFSKYNLAQMEEDVLVVDAVALDNTNTSPCSSFITPKTKFSSHAALLSSTSSNDIVADGHHRLKHPLGSAQNQLRSSHASHRSSKAQIAPADNDEVWPALSRSKAKITQAKDNIWPLPLFSSAFKEEIGCGELEIMTYVEPSCNKIHLLGNSDTDNVPERQKNGHSLAIPTSKTENKMATSQEAYRECGLQCWSTCRRPNTETKTTRTMMSEKEQGTTIASSSESLEIWQSQDVESLLQKLQLRPDVPGKRRLPVFEEIAPS